MELTSLNLPLAALPANKGRGRTFEVRTLPEKVIQLGEAMLMTVNSDAKTMESLFQTFQDFLRKNPRLALDQGFLLFHIDIVVQGIKSSSATTYARTLLSAYHRQPDSTFPSKSPLIGDLFKILELISCEEETEHALDISAEEAWRIIDGLQGALKVAAWLMLVAGFRCKDQTYLMVEDLKFSMVRKEPDEPPKPSMTVGFRWTKNHRSKSERYCITVFPPIFIKELIDMIAGRKFGRLFAVAPEVGALNNALGKVAAPGVTSYSLRRAFIQDIIADNTVGARTEWFAVMRMTGHHRLETLRNSYAKPFENSL
jgi:hypothetical protein